MTYANIGIAYVHSIVEGECGGSIVLLRGRDKEWNALPANVFPDQYNFGCLQTQSE